MNVLSHISRLLGRKHSVRTLDNAERHIGSLFTASDWLIAGFFFVLMALGASMLFVSTSTSLSKEVPVRGGTHVEGVIGSPRFINPLLAISETDNDVTSLVFGGLMSSNADGSLTPYLAERYEVSEDGLIYTFTLKEGITFHDGSPITADDVVFTVQSAKNPEIKSPRRANWEGVEVVALDEHTVAFTLREPYGLFLENTTLGILPKHLWGAITAEEFTFSDLNSDPVGSGMYRVASIKKNSSGVPSEYKLVASKTTDVRPYITNFIFRFYPDQQVLASALTNGEVDAAHSIAPSDAITKNRVTEEAVFARVFGVFFNQNQQELFTDEIVRIALDKALDKKSIVDKVISGYGTVLTGPLPPDEVGNNASNSEDAEAHLRAAEELLIKNGWERGDDGIFTKGKDDKKKRLAFTISTGNASELKRAAETVAETWRALGAEVTLQFFDQSDLNLEIIRPRKYDSLLFGLVVGRELDLFAFWHSTQRNDPGLNIALYANISTDKYLEQARNELDPEKRREQAALAAAEIEQETAAIFLYAPHFTYIHEPMLHGVTLGTISAPSDRFAGIQDWYIHTEWVWPLFIK